MSSAFTAPPTGSDITAATEASHAADRTAYTSERHARLLLSHINRLRLRSDFCDVRLLVGGREFQVHRLVLAASGPYFSALFSGGMSEAREDQVHIAGVDAQVFEVLLDFIYTGTLLIKILKIVIIIIIIISARKCKV